MTNVIYSTLNLQNTCFANNANITSVITNQVAWTNNSMSRAFYHCYNLNSVTTLNNNVTSLAETFSGCNGLTSPPIIPNTVTNMQGTFQYCTLLSSIPTIPNSVNTLYATFELCNALTNLSGITLPNSVTNMWGTFANCYNLTDAPILPSNVANLSFTFRATKIQTPPTIPDSVTNMYATFLDCKNLTTPPSISTNTTNLMYTFRNCTSLTNPTITIPNSVTDMQGTFMNCTNITGKIYVQSNQVSNALTCFDGTSLTKNVYIPFTANQQVTYYAWNDVTTNYYTLASNPNIGDTIYLYNTSNSQYYINALYNTVCGKGTRSNGVAWIRNLDVAGIYIERNAARDGSGMREANTTTYNAFTAAGYDTLGTLHGVYLKDINGISLLINQTPSNASVRMRDINGSMVDFTNWTYTNSGNDYELQSFSTTDTTINVPSIYTVSNRYRTQEDSATIEYIVEKEGYNTVVGTRTITTSETLAVTLTQQTKTLTVYPIPMDATVTITYGSTTVTGKTVTVPYGTSVTITTSKEHYTTDTRTIVVKDNLDLLISLSLATHTFTINPTPSDAIVEIMVNGKLVNGSMTDWTFTAYNLNNDVELQDYTGSATDIVMPTTFTTTNSIAAEYGSVISYKVYKEQCSTVENTITLTQDTTLNITLIQYRKAVNIDGYEYTLNSDLYLNKYTGTDTNVIVPVIELRE